MDAFRGTCQEFGKVFSEDLASLTEIDDKVQHHAEALTSCFKLVHSNPDSPSVQRLWAWLIRSAVSTLLYINNPPSLKSLERFIQTIKPWLIDGNFMGFCYKELTEMYSLARRGPWGHPTLQRLLTGRDVDDKELHDVFNAGLEFIEYRMRSMRLSSKGIQLIRFGKAALAHSQIRQNKAVQEVYQRCANELLSEEDLFEQMDNFDLTVTVSVIDLLVQEKRNCDNLLNAAMKYIWRRRDTQHLEEMATRWMRILRLRYPGNELFDYLSKHLVEGKSSIQSVQQCVVLVRAIWKVLPETSRMVCFEILYHALQLLSSEDQDSEELRQGILSSIAYFLPNSQVSRCCTLTIFILSPTAKHYFGVAKQYKSIYDREKDSAMDCKADLRLNLLEYLKELWPDKFLKSSNWDWPRLRKVCLETMSSEDALQAQQLEQEASVADEASLEGEMKSSSASASASTDHTTHSSADHMSPSSDTACSSQAITESSELDSSDVNRSSATDSCDCVACKIKQQGKDIDLSSEKKQLKNPDDLSSKANPMNTIDHVTTTANFHSSNQGLQKEDNMSLGAKSQANEEFTCPDENCMRVIRNKTGMSRHLMRTHHWTLPEVHFFYDSLENDVLESKSRSLKSDTAVSKPENIISQDLNLEKIPTTTATSNDDDDSNSSQRFRQTSLEVLEELAADISPADKALQKPSEVNNAQQPETDAAILASISTSQSNGDHSAKILSDKPTDSASEVTERLAAPLPMPSTKYTKMIPSLEPIPLPTFVKPDKKELSPPPPPPKSTKPRSVLIKCPIGSCGRNFRHRHTVQAHIEFRHKIEPKKAAQMAEKASVTVEKAKISGSALNSDDNVSDITHSRAWYWSVDDFVEDLDEMDLQSVSRKAETNVRDSMARSIICTLGSIPLSYDLTDAVSNTQAKWIFFQEESDIAPEISIKAVVDCTPSNSGGDIEAADTSIKFEDQDSPAKKQDEVATTNEPPSVTRTLADIKSLLKLRIEVKSTPRSKSNSEDVLFHMNSEKVTNANQAASAEVPHRGTRHSACQTNIKTAGAGFSKQEHFHNLPEIKQKNFKKSKYREYPVAATILSTGLFGIAKRTFACQCCFFNEKVHPKFGFTQKRERVLTPSTSKKTKVIELPPQPPVPVPDSEESLPPPSKRTKRRYDAHGVYHLADKYKDIQFDAVSGAEPPTVKHSFEDALNYAPMSLAQSTDKQKTKRKRSLSNTKASEGKVEQPTDGVKSIFAEVEKELLQKTTEPAKKKQKAQKAKPIRPRSSVSTLCKKNRSDFPLDRKDDDAILKDEELCRDYGKLLQQAEELSSSVEKTKTVKPSKTSAVLQSIKKNTAPVPEGHEQQSKSAPEAPARIVSDNHNKSSVGSEKLESAAPVTESDAGSNDKLRKKASKSSGKRRIDLRRLSNTTKQETRTNSDCTSDTATKQAISAQKTMTNSSSSHSTSSLKLKGEPIVSPSESVLLETPQGNESDFRCPECSKPMTSAFALTCHMRKRHKVHSKKMFFPGQGSDSSSESSVTLKASKHPKNLFEPPEVPEACSSAANSRLAHSPNHASPTSPCSSDSSKVENEDYHADVSSPGFDFSSSDQDMYSESNSPPLHSTPKPLKDFAPIPSSISTASEEISISTPAPTASVFVAQLQDKRSEELMLITKIAAVSENTSPSLPTITQIELKPFDIICKGNFFYCPAPDCNAKYRHHRSAVSHCKKIHPGLHRKMLKTRMKARNAKQKSKVPAKAPTRSQSKEVIGLIADTIHNVDTEKLTTTDSNDANFSASTPRRQAYKEANLQIRCNNSSFHRNENRNSFRELNQLYNKRIRRRVAQSLCPAKSGLKKLSKLYSARDRKESSDSTDSYETDYEAQLPCWCCATMFHRRANLTQHIQYHLWHIDQCEFRCDFFGCLYGFSTADALSLHKERHCKRISICLFCPNQSRTFNSLRQLILHENSQHPSLKVDLMALRKSSAVCKTPVPSSYDITTGLSKQYKEKMEARTFLDKGHRRQTQNRQHYCQFCFVPRILWKPSVAETPCPEHVVEWDVADLACDVLSVVVEYVNEQRNTIECNNLVSRQPSSEAVTSSQASRSYNIVLDDNNSATSCSPSRTVENTSLDTEPISAPPASGSQQDTDSDLHVPRAGDSVSYADQAEERALSSPRISEINSNLSIAPCPNNSDSIQQAVKNTSPSTSTVSDEKEIVVTTVEENQNRDIAIPKIPPDPIQKFAETPSSNLPEKIDGEECSNLLALPEEGLYDKEKSDLLHPVEELDMQIRFKVMQTVHKLVADVEIEEQADYLRLCGFVPTGVLYFNESVTYNLPRAGVSVYGYSLNAFESLRLSFHDSSGLDVPGSCALHNQTPVREPFGNTANTTPQESKIFEIGSDSKASNWLPTPCESYKMPVKETKSSLNLASSSDPCTSSESCANKDLLPVNSTSLFFMTCHPLWTLVADDSFSSLLDISGMTLLGKAIFCRYFVIPRQSGRLDVPSSPGFHSPYPVQTDVPRFAAFNNYLDPDCQSCENSSNDLLTIKPFHDDLVAGDTSAQTNDQLSSDINTTASYNYEMSDSCSFIPVDKPPVTAEEEKNQSNMSSSGGEDQDVKVEEQVQAEATDKMTVLTDTSDHELHNCTPHHHNDVFHNKTESRDPPAGQEHDEKLRDIPETSEQEGVVGLDEITPMAMSKQDVHESPTTGTDMQLENCIPEDTDVPPGDILFSGFMEEFNAELKHKKLSKNAALLKPASVFKSKGRFQKSFDLKLASTITTSNRRRSLSEIVAFCDNLNEIDIAKLRSISKTKKEESIKANETKSPLKERNKKRGRLIQKKRFGTDRPSDAIARADTNGSFLRQSIELPTNKSLVPILERLVDGPELTKQQFIMKVSNKIKMKNIKLVQQRKSSNSPLQKPLPKIKVNRSKAAILKSLNNAKKLKRSKTSASNAVDADPFVALTRAKKMRSKAKSAKRRKTRKLRSEEATRSNAGRVGDAAIFASFVLNDHSYAKNALDRMYHEPSSSISLSGTSILTSGDVEISDYCEEIPATESQEDIPELLKNTMVAILKSPVKSSVNDQTLGTNSLDVTNEVRIRDKRKTDMLPFKRHQTVSSIRAYRCPTCTKWYDNRADFINHLMSSHLDRSKPYPCRYPTLNCHHTFDSKEELLSHHLVHQGPLPVPCIFCSRHFASIEACRAHFISEHTHLFDNINRLDTKKGMLSLEPTNTGQKVNEKQSLQSDTYQTSFEKFLQERVRLSSKEKNEANTTMSSRNTETSAVVSPVVSVTTSSHRNPSDPSGCQRNNSAKKPDFTSSFLDIPVSSVLYRRNLPTVEEISTKPTGTSSYRSGSSISALERLVDGKTNLSLSTTGLESPSTSTLRSWLNTIEGDNVEVKTKVITSKYQSHHHALMSARRSIAPVNSSMQSQVHPLITSLKNADSLPVIPRRSNNHIQSVLPSSMLSKMPTTKSCAVVSPMLRPYATRSIWPLPAHTPQQTASQNFPPHTNLSTKYITLTFPLPNRLLTPAQQPLPVSHVQPALFSSVPDGQGGQNIPLFLPTASSLQQQVDYVLARISNSSVCGATVTLSPSSVSANSMSSHQMQRTPHSFLSPTLPRNQISMARSPAVHSCVIAPSRKIIPISTTRTSVSQVPPLPKQVITTRTPPQAKTLIGDPAQVSLNASVRKPAHRPTVSSLKTGVFTVKQLDGNMASRIPSEAGPSRNTMQPESLAPVKLNAKATLSNIPKNVQVALEYSSEDIDTLIECLEKECYGLEQHSSVLPSAVQPPSVKPSPIPRSTPSTICPTSIINKTKLKPIWPIVSTSKSSSSTSSAVHVAQLTQAHNLKRRLEVNTSFPSGKRIYMSSHNTQNHAKSKFSKRSTEHEGGDLHTDSLHSNCQRGRGVHFGSVRQKQNSYQQSECTYCDVTFPILFDFKVHMLKDHGLLVCTVRGCKEVFGTEESLQNHCVTVHRFKNLNLKSGVFTSNDEPIHIEDSSDEDVTGDEIGVNSTNKSEATANSSKTVEESSESSNSILTSYAKAIWNKPKRSGILSEKSDRESLAKFDTLPQEELLRVVFCQTKLYCQRCRVGCKNDEDVEELKCPMSRCATVLREREDLYFHILQTHSLNSIISWLKKKAESNKKNKERRQSMNVSEAERPKLEACSAKQKPKKGRDENKHKSATNAIKSSESEGDQTTVDDDKAISELQTIQMMSDNRRRESATTSGKEDRETPIVSEQHPEVLEDFFDFKLDENLVDDEDMDSDEEVANETHDTEIVELLEASSCCMSKNKAALHRCRMEGCLAKIRGERNFRRHMLQEKHFGARESWYEHADGEVIPIFRGRVMLTRCVEPRPTAEMRENSQPQPQDEVGREKGQPMVQQTVVPEQPETQFVAVPEQPKIQPIAVSEQPEVQYIVLPDEEHRKEDAETSSEPLPETTDTSATLPHSKVLAETPSRPNNSIISGESPKTPRVLLKKLDNFDCQNCGK